MIITFGERKINLIMKFDSKSEDFLYKYLNNTSPVGYESSGQQIWLDYLRPYIEDYFTDSYGSAVGVVNPNASYKVVIEAHADEIAWYVKYITKSGYMYVCRNGGSDYEIAPSMNAKIHLEGGKYLPAVFGWPAIHVRSSTSSKIGNVENIVLDGGFSSDEEVKNAGIHPGTVVTFDQELKELNNNFLVGKGLDNRIGGFIMAEVVRRIFENNKTLPFALYVVNAVQEEAGLCGAKMIANRISPDLAIITDVTHDTQSPSYNKIKNGDISCGKGPTLSTAPSVQNNVKKMLIDVAKKQKIKFQYEASGSRTGTDTDAFAYSSCGIPSALISTPLKYMHTTVEMVHKNDVAEVINLVYNFLLNLPAGHDFKYFKK